MHRLICVGASAPTTHFASHGLWVLPEPLARELRAFGVALAPQHALLLAAEGPLPLAPGVPVSGPSGGRLVWEPDTAPVRLPIHAETTRRDAALDIDASYELALLGGPTLTLSAVPRLIGRHPRADLVLDDARVSHYHCLAFCDEDGVRIIDLGSTNGTYVDGVRAREAGVRGRARLRVGRTALIVRTMGDAGSELAPWCSAAMRDVASRIDRVAASRAAVLIQGESGVGKDVVARRLHAQSGRGGRFMALNAAVITPSLAASELFGHLRGAFTGADRDRDGAFQAADGGTLFLDEIAELSLEVQAELLRAAELGRVRRVGDAEEVPVDVRIIAATHRDLASRVRSGHFREDLYHRLCVITLKVPPLRERPEDLEAIVEHFLASLDSRRQLTHAAREKLLAHHWSGNVRELLNVLRRADLLSDGGSIDADDLELGPALGQVNQEGIEDMLRERVLDTYEQSGGSVAATARDLGLRRAVVHRIIKLDRDAQKHGLWARERRPGYPPGYPKKRRT